MPLRIATTARNAIVNAIRDLIDAGSGAGVIEIRTGSQPTTPQDTATGTLLATVTLPDPSLPAASSGTASSDPASVTAVATGTAGWCRVKDSTGAAVLDGEVTATGGGGTLTLGTTSLSTGLTVDITSFSVTMPAA